MENVIDDIKITFSEMLGMLEEDEDDAERAQTVALYLNHIRELLIAHLPPNLHHHCIFVMMSRIDFNVYDIEL